MKTKGGTLKKHKSEKGLMRLFQEELKDLYWVEKTLIKSLPRWMKAADSEELKIALENHLVETDLQAAKIEKIFGYIRMKSSAKHCKVVHGILQEAKAMLKENSRGAVRDAGIISFARKVEHYEIASYGTMNAFAKTMDLKKVIPILKGILEEEKMADEKLSELAENRINKKADKKGTGKKNAEP